MLPPGHIAAGFLTATALIKITYPQVSGLELTHLLWWGIFFGFAPDLDMFYSFAKSKAFKTDPSKGSHRLYFSHAPVLWLLAGVSIFFILSDPFWKFVGLLLWLGSWSHFLLDSIQYGIMWLWPLSHKVYSLFPVTNQAGVDSHMQAAMRKSFIGYWLIFLKEYAKGLRISLSCEIVLVIVTFIFYIINYKPLI